MHLYGFTIRIKLNVYQIFQFVLSNTTNIEKNLLYNFLHPWLGTGLLTSTGKWMWKNKYHPKVIPQTKIFYSFFSRCKMAASPKNVNTSLSFQYSTRFYWYFRWECWKISREFKIKGRCDKGHYSTFQNTYIKNHMW